MTAAQLSQCPLYRRRQAKKLTRIDAIRIEAEHRHGASTPIAVEEVLISHPPQAPHQGDHAFIYISRALHKADSLECLLDALREAEELGVTSVQVKCRLAGETARRSPRWTLGYE